MSKNEAIPDEHSNDCCDLSWLISETPLTLCWNVKEGVETASNRDPTVSENGTVLVEKGKEKSLLTKYLEAAYRRTTVCRD